MFGQLHYKTPQGWDVHVMPIATLRSGTRYDVEVVNPDGEVTDNYQLFGWHALEYTAKKNRWKEAK